MSNYFFHPLGALLVFATCVYIWGRGDSMIKRVVVLNKWSIRTHIEVLICMLAYSNAIFMAIAVASERRENLYWLLTVDTIVGITGYLITLCVRSDVTMSRMVNRPRE